MPWIKWVGTFFFLFPRPEFGGAQVIEQVEPYSIVQGIFWETPKRVLVGCGNFIPANEIHKHAYLRGQNLMPDEVSRSMAESFRFQEGFTAPWKIFRRGDVRIADIARQILQKTNV